MIFCSSFWQKPASSLFKASWTPACAGVTVHLLVSLFSGPEHEVAFLETVKAGASLDASCEAVPAHGSMPQYRSKFIALPVQKSDHSRPAGISKGEKGYCRKLICL
jgi:hypothetical protein